MSLFVLFTDYKIRSSGKKNGDTTVTLASPVYKFKNMLFHYCLDRLGDTACSSKTHEIESACNVDTKAAA